MRSRLPTYVSPETDSDESASISNETRVDPMGFTDIEVAEAYLTDAMRGSHRGLGHRRLGFPSGALAEHREKPVYLRV